LSAASSAPNTVVMIPAIGRNPDMVGTLLTNRFADQVLGRHSWSAYRSWDDRTSSMTQSDIGATLGVLPTTLMMHLHHRPAGLTTRPLVSSYSQSNFPGERECRSKAAPSRQAFITLSVPICAREWA
jgi:hypothetical protein